MVKDRKLVGVHCKFCIYSHLCISRNLVGEELEKLNNIINKMFIIENGSHIYRQNQSVKYIYALYSGCCKEYFIDKNGNEIVNNFYFPGDIIGLESFLSKKFNYSVLALKSTQLCAIPRDDFFKLLNENENLLRRFIKVTNKKIKYDHFIPVTTNAKRRVAAFLINIFTRIQKRKETNNHIHLPMSQFDISNLLGLAHETVNRILHLFQKENLIRILNKDIYITNIESLKNIADSSNSPVI